MEPSKTRPIAWEGMGGLEKEKLEGSGGTDGRIGGGQRLGLDLGA